MGQPAGAPLRCCADVGRPAVGPLLLTARAPRRVSACRWGGMPGAGDCEYWPQVRPQLGL